MLEANTLEAAIARIRAWGEANKWTKSRYALEAGLVDTTLRNFHDPEWNPRRETLAALEAIIPPGWQAGDPLPEPATPKRRRAA